jgi:hypothetical protein
MYNVGHSFDKDDNLVWNVHEVATGQIVGEYWFEEDAKHFKKFYESGGGFAGFTPSFILRKINIDVNDAFSIEFAE